MNKFSQLESCETMKKVYDFSEVDIKEQSGIEGYWDKL